MSELEIISRKEAKERGLIHYFTGKPCKNGHVCNRFVSNTTCLMCARSHQKEYSKRNPEKVRDSFNSWKECNQDYFDKYNDWYQKEYYAINRDKKRLYQKEYYDENKEYISERSKEYYRNNLHIYAASRARRRLACKIAEGSHTASDIKRILDRQKNKCAEPTCAKDLSDGYHLDHIMPLSKGGSNWPENLQCLCPRCNLRKHSKHPIDWAQENGRLL